MEQKLYYVTITYLRSGQRITEGRFTAPGQPVDFYPNTSPIVEQPISAHRPLLQKLGSLLHLAQHAYTVLLTSHL